MSRKLLAFKRAPTVEMRFEELLIEVKGNRVLLGHGLNETSVWFSWDEWRDLVRRVEHSIRWIEKNTPDDVTGSSFSVPR